jgi:putative ABC transport system permease protein
MLMVDDILGTVKPLRGRTDLVLFSTIGVLTLVIASLNFMNLQAVQFTKRIREIGVRRITGSSHTALITQLLVETALMALFALALTIPLHELLAPYFNSMLGLSDGGGYVLTLPVIGWLAVAALVLGVLVGLFPAVSASRLSLVSALRGELIKGKTPMAVRSVLIVLQFTISIGLIIGGFTVSNQLDYALSKSLGFDPGNVVRIELPTDEAGRAFPVMHNELMMLSGVASVSAGTTIPTRGLSNGAGYIPEGGTADEMLLTRTVSVREAYFDT